MCACGEKFPCASGLIVENSRIGGEGEISCVAFVIFFLNEKTTLLATSWSHWEGKSS